MKKLIVLILALISLLTFASCGGRGENHTLEFTIPAGFTDAFTFSDKALDYDAFIYSAEEIFPTGKTLTLTNGVKGFVKAEDLEGYKPSNPEEAMAYMEEIEKIESSGIKYVRDIPLYSEDGVTVIGEFTVG